MRRRRAGPAAGCWAGVDPPLHVLLGDTHRGSSCRSNCRVMIAGRRRARRDPFCCKSREFCRAGHFDTSSGAGTVATSTCGLASRIECLDAGSSGNRLSASDNTGRNRRETQARPKHECDHHHSRAVATGRTMNSREDVHRPLRSSSDLSTVGCCRRLLLGPMAVLPVSGRTCDAGADAEVEVGRRRETLIFARPLTRVRAVADDGVAPARPARDVTVFLPSLGQRDLVAPTTASSCSAR